MDGVVNPIMFTLAGTHLNASGKLGTHPPMFGFMPMPPMRLIISGVTKNGSNGSIIGSCTVTLYRTLDDMVFEEVVSDAVTGAYTFSAIGPSETYYIVAYKAGIPDLSGTTVNTLFGA